MAGQYSSAVKLANNVMALARWLWVRTESGIGKAYNYIFDHLPMAVCTSTARHYDFPDHHFAYFVAGTFGADVWQYSFGQQF